MFCPDCGLEDKQTNQFCRSCGIDLRPVKAALSTPDDITASAVSARDEIGRAVAAKIRESSSPAELAAVAENVLPEVEKFLESPEERRLRRIRAGMTLSSVGLGTAFGISLVSFFMNEDDILFLAALGIITFFIGLGFILNGVFLTVPKKSLREGPSDAGGQRELDASDADLPEVQMPAAQNLFSSVTEHTTKQLQVEKYTNNE